MFSFFSSLRGVSGNGVETYQCAGCRGLVTHSDRLLRINASDRHFFLNPAGVECDFYTFSDCPGVVSGLPLANGLLPSLRPTSWLAL
jgi:hypothetical protein